MRLCLSLLLLAAPAALAQDQPAVASLDRFVLWTQELRPTGRAVLGGGAAFLETDDGLLAIDLASGRVRWRVETAPRARPADAPLSFDRDRLFRLRDDGAIDVLRAVDGRVSATLSEDGTGFVSAPVAGGERLLGATRDGHLHAFGRDDLSRRWRIAAPDDRPGLAADGERVYWVSGRGLVAAYDLETGAEVWSRLHGVSAERSERFLPPHAGGGRVMILPRGSSVLRSLDAATGALIWAKGLGDGDRLVGPHGGRIAIGGSPVELLDLAGASGEIDLGEWTPAGDGILGGDAVLVPVRTIGGSGQFAIARVQLDDGGILILRCAAPGDLHAHGDLFLLATEDRLLAFDLGRARIDPATIPERLARAEALFLDDDPAAALQEWLGLHADARGMTWRSPSGKRCLVDEYVIVRLRVLYDLAGEDAPLLAGLPPELVPADLLARIEGER